MSVARGGEKEAVRLLGCSARFQSTAVLGVVSHLLFASLVAQLVKNLPACKRPPVAQEPQF